MFAVVLFILAIFFGLPLFGFLHLRRKLRDLEIQVSDLNKRALLAQARAVEAGEIGEPPSKKSAPGQQIDLPEQKTSAGPWDQTGETVAAAKTSAAEVKSAEPTPPKVVSDEAEAGVASPRRYVFSADAISRFSNWAQANWFYLIAAVSLGLAGVFLVQYGAEQGLLSPELRVLSAVGLGAILIVVGEYLRRRGGNSPQDLFAYLPSTFAAGGLISMYSGVLAARSLYGLIAAETAMGGLAGAGVLAVFIGWYYGPLLAAIGILGAIAAPFVVEADAGSSELLYYYFAVIILSALAIDTLKRWAWLSSFALLAGFGAASLLYGSSGGGLHFIGFSMAALLGAVIIPERNVVPRHSGAMLLEELIGSQLSPSQISDAGTDHGPSEFPTRVAALVFAAATFVPLWVHQVQNDAFWVSMMALVMLFLAATLWMRQARALADLTLLPVLALLGLLFNEANAHGSVYTHWLNVPHLEAEAAIPPTIYLILVVGLLVSLVAALRSFKNAPYPLIWAYGAAAFTPIIALVLELKWRPGEVLGDSNWAYLVIGIAAVMVALAYKFGRSDGVVKTRAALFALAAMTMISLAMVIILTSAALTLALAAMALFAAFLGRRYNMPPLAIFVQIGAVISVFRLVVEPGIFWAADAPFWEFLAAYLGVIVLFAASWLVLGKGIRRITFTVVDGALWSVSSVFASLLIYRLVEVLAPGREDSIAVSSLIGSVWLISCANQLRWLRNDGVTRWVRAGLATTYGAIGLMIVVATGIFSSPLVQHHEPVFGPYILDSLFLMYVIPALILSAVAIRLTHLAAGLRYVAGGGAILWALIYIGLEIRRFWRGNDLAVAGTTDPELYTYTVAMLLISAGVLFYAFYKRSAWLRKLALAGIGLTVAKVFLIDVSGLTGLTRVFSFLVLGLALAGLAWLDRWFGARDPEPKAQDPAD